MWGSSFVGWHPARIRRSFRPPRPLLRRSLTLTHSLTHSLILHITHSLTDTTQDLTTHSLTHSLTPLTHSLTHSLTHTPRACHPETAEGAAARVVAAGPPSLSAVAGAVPRASRRGCGARCRRWAPLALCSGRRSTQSLQKGLRCALSPLGPPRSLQWQAQYPEPPEWGCGARCRRWAPLALCSGRRSTQSLQKGAAARVVAAGPPSLSAVAGAVPRASRRGCGARCRRWAPCGSVRYCHCDLQRNGCDRLRIAL